MTAALAAAVVAVGAGLSLGMFALVESVIGAGVEA